jgi:hypothetical protein
MGGAQLDLPQAGFRLRQQRAIDLPDVPLRKLSEQQEFRNLGSPSRSAYASGWPSTAFS